MTGLQAYMEFHEWMESLLGEIFDRGTRSEADKYWRLNSASVLVQLILRTHVRLAQLWSKIFYVQSS